MDYSNINTESRKNKNLNYEERITIQLRLKDGAAPYKIAKEYYSKHRLNSYRTFKLLECSDFINYTVDKIKNNSWSPMLVLGKQV